MYRTKYQRKSVTNTLKFRVLQEQETARRRSYSKKYTNADCTDML